MSDSTGQISGDTPTVSGDGTGPSDRREGQLLAPGDVIGRYVVLAKLGTGGMGVVYAAYDPELDRNVALKLLHDSARNDDTARVQLQREAKALAKLSHPNIVAVHDLGTVGERVWIAMELVAGTTLRDWLRTGPRPWREVVARMSAAGRGLMAAHAAGLVHGDFKPDNVMLGDDGRVRVMDFGLARMAADEDGRATGSLAGTASYMAAEQLAGSVADAHTDQFAFCVALWEALYGGRPFAGDTMPELVANVLDGRLRSAPARSNVPAWLRRACERGLDRDPARRWPTMADLLDAFERNQATAARRRVVFVGLGVALIVSGAFGVRELDSRRRVPACEELGASIDEVWNDDARETMKVAMLATDVSYAGVSAQKVTPWLGGARWRNCTRAGLCACSASATSNMISSCCCVKTPRSHRRSYRTAATRTPAKSSKRWWSAMTSWRMIFASRVGFNRTDTRTPPRRPRSGRRPPCRARPRPRSS